MVLPPSGKKKAVAAASLSWGSSTENGTRFLTRKMAFCLESMGIDASSMSVWARLIPESDTGDGEETGKAALSSRWAIESGRTATALQEPVWRKKRKEVESQNLFQNKMCFQRGTNAPK